MNNNTGIQQTLVREGHFESCHRITCHKGKCRNIHGHSYKYELEISYDASNIDSSGYLIDFGDIKKYFEDPIDKFFDHSTIANSNDKILIKAAKKINDADKLIVISGYEPSVEIISITILKFLNLIAERKKLPEITGISLWETAKCRCRTTISNKYNTLALAPITLPENLSNYIQEISR